MRRAFCWNGFLLIFLTFCGSLSAYGECPVLTGNLPVINDGEPNRNVEVSRRLEPSSFAVRVAPSLPPLTIRLVPDTSALHTEWRLHHVGRVEICKQGSSVPFQTIEVQSYADGTMFSQFFEFRDVNFDGYTDIGTLYDFGAKWGSYQYYIFDSGSQRFVQNQLTEELSRIRANGHDFDSQSKTLHVGHMVLGEGVIDETYTVISDHLVLVEVTERVKDENGALKVITHKP